MPWLWRLIWVCTVHLCPTKRMLDLYGLTALFLQYTSMYLYLCLEFSLTNFGPNIGPYFPKFRAKISQTMRTDLSNFIFVHIGEHVVKIGKQSYILFKSI